MGGRQSTNTNANTTRLNNNNNSVTSTASSTNGTSGARHNGTASTAAGSAANSALNSSAVNSGADWRQRARSLSSVLGAAQHSNGAIGVPQGHSSFGLSTSPDSDTSTEDGLSFGRVFSAHSLPVQLVSFNGIKCPVCSKFVLPDDVECHLVMCLTKPRINYNEDILLEDKGECVICLEELIQGDTIARLPCLCIYHKICIDAWFEVNRSCPEHPSD